MKKRPVSLLGLLFATIAPRIGAKVIMEPEWRVVGRIAFKNGRNRYFRWSTLDLNPVGASEIAKDKDYANFFMRKMGHPTVPGRTFFSKAWARAIGSRRGIDAAYRYARDTLGLPVIVKPNSGSQGIGVAKAYDRPGFYRAMRAAFRNDRVVLVQRPVEGRDYRVVVLDGRVISAYERIPLHVKGNGRASVRRLLDATQARFRRTGRDTVIRIDDRRIAENLARRGMTMRTVLPKGETLFLLDNANLSTGGDAVDVTSRIHPAFRDLAVNLTRDMGLRLCGVDLMVAGGGIEAAPERGQHWILEINAAPGLDHYMRAGKAQRKIVEDMYLEVLKALE